MPNETSTAKTWWVVYFYDAKRCEIGRMITKGTDQQSVVEADYRIAGCSDVRAVMVGNEDNLPPPQDRHRLLQGDDKEAVFANMRHRLLTNITVWIRDAESHG